MISLLVTDANRDAIFPLVALARKYAQLFVHGHYLFREANRFPNA